MKKLIKVSIVSLFSVIVFSGCSNLYEYIPVIPPQTIASAVS